MVFIVFNSFCFLFSLFFLNRIYYLYGNPMSDLVLHFRLVFEALFSLMLCKMRESAFLHPKRLEKQIDSICST